MATMDIPSCSILPLSTQPAPLAIASQHVPTSPPCLGARQNRAICTQCLRYHQISIDIDNGNHTDSEIASFSSLGIYGAREKPEVLLTSGNLMASCFIEYCQVAPNNCLPVFLETAMGPYGTDGVNLTENPYLRGSVCTTTTLF